jgi:hypothetical protein
MFWSHHPLGHSLHVEPSSPQCNEGHPRMMMVTAKCFLPTPTTQSAVSHLGTRFLPKFCLHELILQQAYSTLWGDWLHKHTWDCTPPSGTSPTTKLTPPDHASFFRTSLPTRSSYTGHSSQFRLVGT